MNLLVLVLLGVSLVENVAALPTMPEDDSDTYNDFQIVAPGHVGIPIDDGKEPYAFRECLALGRFAIHRECLNFILCDTPGVKPQIKRCKYPFKFDYRWLRCLDPLTTNVYCGTEKAELCQSENQTRRKPEWCENILVPKNCPGMLLRSDDYTGCMSHKNYMFSLIANTRERENQTQTGENHDASDTNNLSSNFEEQSAILNEKLNC